MSFLFTNCITEIDLDTEGSQPSIVIQGKVTTDKKAFEVTIKESAQFAAGADGAEIPINNAQVKVMDDEGNVEVLTQVSDGTYHSRDDFQGILGRTYELEVILSDGATYRSSPETIQPVPSPDSAYIRFEDPTNDALVFINTPFLEGQETYLTWNFRGEWQMSEIGNIFNDICYIQEDIDFGNAPVVSSENVNGNYLPDQFVFTRNVDHRFSLTYAFHIYLSAIIKSKFR